MRRLLRRVATWWRIIYWRPAPRGGVALQMVCRHRWDACIWRFMWTRPSGWYARCTRCGIYVPC